MVGASGFEPATTCTPTDAQGRPAIINDHTVRQVAGRLGVCAATIYKWAAIGLLQHVRILNVVRVRREDLIRFLMERRQS